MLRSKVGFFIWILGIVLYCYGRTVLISPNSGLMHHEFYLWTILVDLTPFLFGLWLGAGVAGRAFSLHVPLLLGSILLALPFLYYLLSDFGLFGLSGLINVLFRPDEPIAFGLVLVLSFFPPHQLQKARKQNMTF